MGNLKFGEALEAVKAGRRAARDGWNGKGMWIAYSPGAVHLPAEKFWSGQNQQHALRQGGKCDVLPCLTMKTATGAILMGWLASQSDMLAEDWEVLVDEPPLKLAFPWLGAVDPVPRTVNPVATLPPGLPEGESDHVPTPQAFRQATAGEILQPALATGESVEASNGAT